MNEYGQLHFKVGGGLGELVRDAFWYEQRFDWAKEVLRCFEGILPEQIDAILRGDAFLKPIDDGKRVEIVFKEDKKFKQELFRHVGFVKQRIEQLYKDRYELEKGKDKIEFSLLGDPSERTGRIFLLTNGIKEIEKKIELFEEMLSQYDKLFQKRVIPQLTTNVGGYEVPTSLLDEYVGDVVRRIRISLKLGTILSENPLEVLELEKRRQVLHERILEAVGFGKSGRKGKKYREFAEVLEEFLESMGAGL